MITHPAMTRYFMLIEEAVQLVLQAVVLIDQDEFNEQHSLDTFILEMGNPVSIVDLAQRMIDFYWKDNSHSLGVEFSGLRPGEKLEEHLIYEYETTVVTRHPLVKRVYAKAGLRSSNGHGSDFQRLLDNLIELAEKPHRPTCDHQRLDGLRARL